MTLENLKNDGEIYLRADGFDDALIGFVWPKETGLKTAVYSISGCIDVLMARDGMTEEDADDHFYFNVSGAYVGVQTPFFVDSCDRSA